MNKPETSCEIHRHNDRVAFHFDSTETLYVEADLARKIGKALVRYADDINSTPFVKSQLGTTLCDSSSHRFGDR